MNRLTRRRLVASVFFVVVVAIACILSTSRPARAMMMIEPPAVVAIDSIQPANLSLRSVTISEAPGWSVDGQVVSFDYGLTSDPLAIEPTEAIGNSTDGHATLDLTNHDPNIDWYVISRANTWMFSNPFTTAWSSPYIVAGPNSTTPPLPVPAPVPSPTPAPTQTKLKWVALGDSYSSGEGVEPFVSNTNISGNQCHRSTKSYSRDIVKANSKKYSLEFRACSGALISDLYTANHDNRLEDTPQIDWVKGDTDIVTLTIGGNDAYFADVMTYCATRTSLDKTCQDKWQVRVEKITKDLKNRYANIIHAIKKAAPNAQVYLMGYPRFFPASPPKNCPTGAPGFVFGRSDMNWLNSEVKTINDTARAGAQLEGATYVDAYNMVGNSHDLCDSNPWINRAVPRHRPYSFHPTIDGQKELAHILASALS